MGYDFVDLSWVADHNNRKKIKTKYICTVSFWDILIPVSDKAKRLNLWLLLQVLPIERSFSIPQKLPSVFVIGSSTTLLFGPYLKQMLQGFYTYGRKGEESDEIQKAFEDLDSPQGASAGDSARVLDYLNVLDQTDVFRPDVVLLHVGTHDIKHDVITQTHQVPLEEYGKNVEAIVDWFVRKHIELIWIQNGPIDEKLHNARSKKFHRYEADMDAYNEVAEKTMKQRSVAMLDLPGFMKNLGPLSELLKDHVHYTDDVVKLQAAFIAGFLIDRIDC